MRTRSIAFLLAAATTSLAARSQNLVPNGEFEQFTSCPSGFGQIDHATPWMNPAVDPAAATPDYFNACASSGALSVPNNYAGFQPAHSGGGYAFIVLYRTDTPEFREYLEVPLTAPLVGGSCYWFQMQVNLALLSNYATDAIGVHFSDTAIVGIPGNDVLPFVPQLVNTGGFLTDTLNWVSVAGLYEAHGGESYLLIGNFNDDASTATMLVGTPGTYSRAYYYIDDVSLVGTSCTNGVRDEHNQEVIIYPNPVADELFVKAAAPGTMSMLIRDASGRIVRSSRFSGTLSTPLGDLSPGMYTAEFMQSNGSVGRRAFIKE